LALTAAYGVLLLIGLGNNSIRWDELVHCLGGWQLLHGRTLEYLTTNTFYPPMFNLATAACFGVGGASVICARLVSVTFSLLSVAVLFEFANRIYGSRTALLSAVFFAVMPGLVWASRLAYIETMLVFFFLLSLFFYFSWQQTGNTKSLILGGLALGLGFLVKYQALVAGLVMLAALFLGGRSCLKSRLARFALVALVAGAFVVSWVAVVYVYAPDTLNQWNYAISVGDQHKSVYGARFPTPVFYLIEMTAPYPDMHPVSLFLYVLGFAGLALLVWRRKLQDRLLLSWFAVVYVVFTLIGNREWRYMLPLFPVLAVSASNFVSFSYNKLRASWHKASKQNSRRLFKAAAGILIVFSASAVFVSCSDAYHWVWWDQVNVPIQESVNYVAGGIQANESLLLVCPFELFSGGMASFYLQMNNKKNTVLQYPSLPTDTFTPTFKLDELVAFCQQNSVKHVLISEHHWPNHYFNTSLTPQDVAKQIWGSGRFINQTVVGAEPDRVFIMSFR
jgi:hypothetical protein